MCKDNKYVLKKINLLFKFNLLISIIILGALFNVFVVATNDGRMPVYSLSQDTDTHFGFQEREEINNWFLSDIFRLPIKNPSIFFSIGDVIMILSYFVLIYTVYQLYDISKNRKNF